MRPYRGRRSFDIVDPIAEPIWSGARVLANVVSTSSDEEHARVTLIEALGADVAPELPALREAVGRAVLAHDAILDGVITRQVGLDGIGAAPDPGGARLHHRPADAKQRRPRRGGARAVRP